MKIKDVIVEDSRIQDIHSIVTGQPGHKGRSIGDKIMNVLMGGMDGWKNAATVIKYLKAYGLSDGEISQVRDIANQAGKATLDYIARKEEIPDKWIANDMKSNFIVYSPFLNAGDEVIEKWKALTNKIMLPKLEKQLGNGTYVESAEQLAELDNGPNGTYNDGVNYARRRQDPAKADYSGYGAQAKATRTAQSAERKAAKSAAARATRAKQAVPGGPANDLSSVMMAIDAAIGNCFPDGDPIDYLQKYDMRTLDKAVRQWAPPGSAKNYNDYVAQVWQQHLDDNPDQDWGENPWTESVEEGYDDMPDFTGINFSDNEPQYYEEPVGRYKVMKQLNDPERNPEGAWSLIYSTSDPADAEEVANEQRQRFGKFGDVVKVVDAGAASSIKRPMY